MELNYKKWAITQRIKELEKAIKRWPESIYRQQREYELENLKKDLEP